jgi:DNA-3-methyladenine glycosylase II
MINLDLALTHLKSSDRIIADLINRYGRIDSPPQSDIFPSLVYSVIEQQLSGKATLTIYNRFLNLFPDKSFTPEQILALELSQLRGIGTSWAKAASLHDLSRKVLDGSLNLLRLPEMNDEDIIQHLIQVKGIGVWSAQMRLMFSFHRPDVFPETDVGIQNAFVKNYGLNRKHKIFVKKMLKISSAWHPYRTVACWYLWASLDNRP